MRRHRARGFTLVEVIIATVLFAGLMTMYYQVFIGVVELEEYARASRAFSSVGPAILDLIEDDVQSLHVHPRAADAYPFRGSDEDMASQPADRFDFVARRLSIRQEQFFGEDRWIHSPINEVGYRLGRGLANTTTRRLYRREAFYVDGTPLEDGDYYEVYDRVVGFDVRYVGFRVEESERTDQDTLREHQYESFESWDSDQRKGFPTAMVVTLTIEAPQLTHVERDRRNETPPRRTFVRIIPLIQADDIAPPPPGTAGPNQPATPPTAPSRPGPSAPGR